MELLVNSSKPARQTRTVIAGALARHRR